MVYTVYKTTNKITGRYYFGMHKTADPNDDYLGSGLVVKRAIKKYKVENFIKEVLFIFDELQSALEQETRLIEEHISDPLCYNIHEGGFGGFDRINVRGLNNKNDNHKAATEARLQKMKDDPEFHARMVEASKKGAAKARKNPKFGAVDLDALRLKSVAAWTGQKHSEVSKKKMSESHQGTKNHFFGRRWMHYSGIGNKPVKADEIDIHIIMGWIFGRVAER